MGRPKTFDDAEVLQCAANAFVVGGYEGTSVDDLVKALNLHRGSLYKAFGSKRGLFLAVLGQYVRSSLPLAIQAACDDPGATGVFEALTVGTHLDLLLVAALERGHHDVEVALLVQEAMALLDGLALSNRHSGDPRKDAPGSPPGQAIRLIGTRLSERVSAGALNSENSARNATKGI